MKARDIIANWPRGRTTSSHRHAVKDDWIWLLHTYNPRAQEELAATADYHKAQQRMIDTFFARWRTTRPKYAVTLTGLELT